MNSRSDGAANLAKIYEMLQECKKRGASLVSMPEGFYLLGCKRDVYSEKAERMDGPLMKKMSGWAKEFGLWLSLGGLQEPSEDKERIYNTHILMDTEGEIRQVYRKTHLFDIDIPGAPHLKESAFTMPGPEILPPFETPFARVGLSICYDLRFPELYRKFFYAGVDMILVPSAFLVKTGQAHWEVLLRARAM